MDLQTQMWEMNRKKNLVPQVSPGKSIITVSSENNVTVLIPWRF
jgi:hypothetical protein